MYLSTRKVTGPDNPANYRPVSLTPHIIKVFERVIRSKMVEYLETNKLLNKNQHGFRKGRNCLSQLLDHYDELLNTVSNSSNADVVYLDYSKAFDKVDHHILLQKLERIGITGKLYRWLECFLTDRVQQVIVDGVSSSFAIVISGVPQGTVLGPLLFIVFVDDMSEVVKHSILKLFADDSKLSKAIRSMLDQILLQEDVNAILLWAKDNNMELNEEKFQLIQHGKISHLKPTTSEIYKTSQGTSLNPTDVVVDLGVTGHYKRRPKLEIPCRDYFPQSKTICWMDLAYLQIPSQISHDDVVQQFCTQPSRVLLPSLVPLPCTGQHQAGVSTT